MKMERSKASAHASEKLLAILERNAAGLSPQDREKKWDALEKVVSNSNRAKMARRATPPAPASIPHRKARKTA
jgi:hypothetical protein